MAQTLGRLPGRLLRNITGVMATTVDVHTTNVPGVPFPVFLAGAKVQSLHAFINNGRSPLSAALLSYNGAAHIALTVNQEAVPDVDFLRSCIQAELDCVLALGRAKNAHPSEGQSELVEARLP